MWRLAWCWMCQAIIYDILDFSYPLKENTLLDVLFFIPIVLKMDPRWDSKCRQMFRDTVDDPGSSSEYSGGFALNVAFGGVVHVTGMDQFKPTEVH